AFLGLVSVLISWRTELRPREYFAWLLVLETSLLGVFSALDFVLFFLFWEIELVPMYFLISVCGSGNRVYSAWKYVLYTFFASAGRGPRRVDVAGGHRCPQHSLRGVDDSDPAGPQAADGVLEREPCGVRAVGGVRDWDGRADGRFDADADARADHGDAFCSGRDGVRPGAYPQHR